MIDQFEPYSESNSTLLDLSPQKIRLTMLQSFKILSKASPSQVQLTRAHQNISDMMKHQSFMQNCISLLEQFQESTAFANIPKLVITTLSTYLKHQQSSSQLVKKIDRYTLNTALIEIFFKRSISESNRLLIVKSYLQFIYAPGMQTIRTQTIDLLCNNFGLCAVKLRHELSNNQQLQEDFVADIMSYVMVARTITKGPIHHMQLKQIVKAYLPTLQILTKTFLTALISVIKQQNQQKFIYVSGICDRLIQFIKELIVMTSKDSLYLVKLNIMKDTNIRDIIYDALKISLDPQLPYGNIIHTLVLQSNGNKYVDRINQFKKNCVAIVIHYAKLCVVAQSDLKEFEKQQYQIPLQICSHFITHVPEVLLREFQQLKYPQKELPHAGLYRGIITALSYIIRLHKFFNEAFQLRSKFFFRLCLPLLQRKQTELYISAEQFKGRREDILNMHNQDIPENAVCKLIESYVDRVDGSITFYCLTLQNMIEFHLSANPNIFVQLPAELTQSSFFQNTGYQVQIECGLLIFSLFSYLSVGRGELVEIVEKLLVRRKEFFFSVERTGMFKSAVLLTYSYYVDNFYALLKEGKSPYKNFHIEVLQHCCTFIDQFTKSQKIEEERRGEHLALQIGALQSIDCISNCIGQKDFLPALFFGQEGVHSKVKEAVFYNLFNFLLNLLSTSLNVKTIEVLTQFLVESIRSQCQKGAALKRFHYEYKEVPMAIRVDVCQMISQRIYNFYGAAIPHATLMKSKIINLIQVALTCCQFPDLFMSRQFFQLKVSEEDVWQVAEPIDIFLRRMIIFKQENRAINEAVLQQITLSAANLLQLSRRDYKMHCLFGILVNLIVLKEELVDDLAPFLTNTLMQLLKEEDQSINYEEELEEIIQKIAYVNLIAINTSFTQRSQASWCTLTECIQTFLFNRSSKGIIAAKSIPYIGKLLAISLVCLYQFKANGNMPQGEQAQHLWTNILRTADVYSTTAEKQIVASVFIGMLGNRGNINQTDQQCKRCFSMIAHVLYKAYSSSKKVAEDYGDDPERESSGLDSDSEEQGDQQHLNYKEYTIACNQYSAKEKKQKYITLFKTLCHKFKQQSPDFFKTVVETLPPPISAFVKSKVFYFESLGQSGSSLRKVIKVKKEIPNKE